MEQQDLMEKIVSLCKRRGFIFQGSEIYGGLAGVYDYGHYGYLLKENITEDVKFANSILLCAISYLLGGNSLTQKSIIEELAKD
mgnify:CR=1 FL=1